MSGTTVLGAFNKHFIEFVNEIESMFNKNLNLFSSVLSEED